MRTGLASALLFGIVGVIILVGLGTWQMQRLEWKEDLLARIEARISADPVALPPGPDPEADRYLPTALSGRFDDGVVRVLVSHKQMGAGYRLISPFETEGRRIMIDRGFIRVNSPLPDVPAGPVNVVGNLHWPDDRLASTPGNDLEGNIWFARDIAEMAEFFAAEPVLVIAREIAPPEPEVTPFPVDTTGIPNDHLSYAATWFSLAVLWAAMTGLLLWRRHKAGRTG